MKRLLALAAAAAVMSAAIPADAAERKCCAAGTRGRIERPVKPVDCTKITAPGSKICAGTSGRL